jgi:membrane-associated phospholipid phosphatase
VSTTSATPPRLERSAGRALGKPAHEPTEERYPVLAPAPPARVQSLLDRYGPERPAAVFAVVLVAGYLLLAAATIAVGLLLVHVVLSVAGIRSADEELPHAFAAHRSDLLDGLSLAGSMVGDIPVLPLLVTVVAVVAAWHRRWRVAAFIVAVGLLELATYRVASLLIHRDRPDVPHLDDLPLAQSYPSGHVAASVAVYGGIALLLTSRFPARWVRVLCWSLVVVLPLIVALSRLYRGMHHPLDELAGACMGAGAILIALAATRAYGEAVRRQADRRARVQPTEAAR